MNPNVRFSGISERIVRIYVSPVRCHVPRQTATGKITTSLVIMDISVRGGCRKCNIEPAVRVSKIIATRPTNSIQQHGKNSYHESEKRNKSPLNPPAISSVTCMLAMDRIGEWNVWVSATPFKSLSRTPTLTLKSADSVIVFPRHQNARTKASVASAPKIFCVFINMSVLRFDLWGHPRPIESLSGRRVGEVAKLHNTGRPGENRWPNVRPYGVDDV